PDAAVMEDEIFGPILPVLTYEQLDDAIAFVNERPKPLALYVFGSRATAIDRVVTTTIEQSRQAGVVARIDDPSVIL
ncbi:MAG TPA: aldehyde dehydrogenase family protein, partial [Ilumatobacter sp.]